MKADSPFADLLGWIQGNLSAPLDVARLAARAGLSERSFHRKFVAATGETPARFVEAARLDAARMLLSHGLPLKLVAAQVGLFPPSRLNRAFEQRFGLSPPLFREVHAELRKATRRPTFGPVDHGHDERTADVGAAVL